MFRVKSPFFTVVFIGYPRPLSGKANVYLAGFDGREDRWGRAARSWNSSSCQQKLEDLTALGVMSIG
jgi:hypothetical protein